MTKLTIIPDDNIIIVDGVAIAFENNIDIDSDIHAVQWNGSSGQVEYKTKDTRILTSNEYESYIDLYNNEKKRLEDIAELKKQEEQAEIESVPLYQRNRSSDDGYYSISEQLDMIYWDKKNGSNNWENHIDEIKSKFPKNI